MAIEAHILSGSTLAIDSGAKLEVDGYNSFTQGSSVWIMTSYLVDRLLMLASGDGKSWSYIDARRIYPTLGVGGAADIIWFNGKFYRAYTTDATSTDNFQNNSFAVDTSFNLIDWTVIANPSFSSITNTSGAVWAQNWFQEPGTTDFTGLHVFSAVSIGNNTGPFAMYETHPTNSDLTAWSTPTAITGTSLTTNVIDPSVTKIGSTYYLYFKNETTHFIGYWTSSSLTSGYVVVQSGATDVLGLGICEAPDVVLVTPGLYRIYTDHYVLHGFFYSESTDNLASWSSPVQCAMPWPSQHPGVTRLQDVNVIRAVLGSYLSNGQFLTQSQFGVGIGVIPDRPFIISGDYGSLNGQVAIFSNASGVNAGINFGRNNIEEFFFGTNGTGWTCFNWGASAFVYQIPYASNNFEIVSGNLNILAAGKTVTIKSGSNAKAGTFTLVAGAATVANTSVTANSVIVASVKTSGGVLGLYAPLIIINPGTGFSVTGAATDTSTYGYVIFEVA